jgi:hypothetical protein
MMAIPAVARSQMDCTISSRVGHPLAQATYTIVHVNVTNSLIYVFILVQRGTKLSLQGQAYALHLLMNWVPRLQATRAVHPKRKVFKGFVKLLAYRSHPASDP